MTDNIRNPTKQENLAMNDDPLNFTAADAADIAAECVASLDWQTTHIIAAMDTDAVDVRDFLSATTPMRPATIRLVTAMKTKWSNLSAIMPAGRPMEMRIQLMGTTCNSIAHNLRSWGFEDEAEQIFAALERSNEAAREH